MAASKGNIVIYDETNTVVYRQAARAGDYVSTVNLQGNKLTFSNSTPNTVVYVTEYDEIELNTKNITIASTPTDAVTQTVITLPIEPSSVDLATGTTDIEGFGLTISQGETKTTAYGAGMNSGAGAVIYYQNGGDKMTINVTKSAGVVLKTEGKYCAEDITVVPVLEEKSVTPTESAQEVVPSDGKCGLSKVIFGAVQTDTKTITPSTSQQTFTPTSGKYFKQVICQAIQIETKTVAPSASAQTYTPSTGKYFANFTVSAVPSQSKTVTPTKSVQTVNADSGKWLSSVTVNPIPDDYIQPTGEQNITANGTYDIKEKASVKVAVPLDNPITDVATSSAMDALLVEANVGKYYKFTGTTDSNYTNGDLYLVESDGE